MAEDRKPKIDLKSRLQKIGGQAGPTPNPPATGSVPAPSRSIGPTQSSVPPPPGLSRSGRPIDAANPLAAVANSFAPAGGIAALAQPQRIEIDETVVSQARRGGFKGGLVVGVVFGGILLVLGWVAGNASTQGNARAQSTRDAHELAGDLLKAKDSLEQLKLKLQAGGKTLLGDRKFPPDLAQQLSGMNIDFGGDKLFGRRFSGVPADTTRELFDFITRVQSLNDKKALVVALLNKLQKPITEELSRPPGQFSYVVVVDKDTSESGAFLSPLATPIGPDNRMPGELTFVNPRASGNVKLPRLVGDKVPRDGAAILIVPNNFEKVCPSKTHGQIAQLGSSMNSLIDDIQGQRSAEGGDVITESKPGLSEAAAKLADQLNKVN
jgi:hypothetical protein